ncbi:hypothetical protein BGZ81_003576 [Podila clonocystis]|nr:hypothetical protein BGZ81_003576 [Podila clonocystis]
MDGTSTTQSVQVQHIHNATIKIKYADTTFLDNPILGRKDAYPDFEGTYRSHLRNPMVELPMPAEDSMEGMDAVIVSHTHLDDSDDAAQELLPKGLCLHRMKAIPISFVQMTSPMFILWERTLFSKASSWQDSGQHGTDSMYSSCDVAEILCKVMDIVLQAPGSKIIYVAGDTMCKVDQTLTKLNPDVTILNTGDARLIHFNDFIIMGKDDTLHTHRAAPNATIIVVHVDAINHTALTR